MSELNAPKARVNETFELIIQGKKEELRRLACNRGDSRESEGYKSKKKDKYDTDKNSERFLK